MALDAPTFVGQSQIVYRIIGADGKEYGPVSAEQLGKWVAEGRVNAETRAAAEGSTTWIPVGSIPEFCLWFAKPPAPPAVPTSLAPARPADGLAVASLVMGILSVTVGICCYGIPFNVLGLVFALVALSQIRQNPQRYGGKAAATVGLVLSLFSLFLAAALVVLSGFLKTWGALGHHVHRL